MRARLMTAVVLTIPLMAIGERNAGAQVKALTSAIIQVQGSASPIVLAPTRDADVSLATNKGGLLKVRFDKLRDTTGNLINTVDNKVEFEIVVNGGSPQVRETLFAIVQGFAEVETLLGLSQGDIVEIRRLDVFDDNDIRFATLGVRIQNPTP